MSGAYSRVRGGRILISSRRDLSAERLIAIRPRRGKKEENPRENARRRSARRRGLTHYSPGEKRIHLRSALIGSRFLSARAGEHSSRLPPSRKALLCDTKTRRRTVRRDCSRRASKSPVRIYAAFFSAPASSSSSRPFFIVRSISSRDNTGKPPLGRSAGDKIYFKYIRAL